MNDKKRKRFKLLLLPLLAVLIFLAIRFLIPLCKMLVTEEGRGELCARVESYGILAPVVFTLLMALQIIIAFIPGGPLELVGGMLFGGWQGILYTTLGALLGTLTVFCLVKKFGRPLVEVFISEKKMHQFKVLEDENKLSFWVFLLFLIPGIPKDLLTYFVPLTRMDGKQFVLLSTLGRFPSLAASVLVGDSLSEGQYRRTICICAVAAILCFVGFQVRNYVIKEHKKKQ